MSIFKIMNPKNSLITEITYGKDIILYHYSKNKYNELKTLNLQNDSINNITTNDDGYKFRGDPGPYEDHISLFLERPPFDILPDIFPKDHHIWVKGNKFIEHSVNLTDIDLYHWKLIETNIDNFFTNNLWIENDIYKYLFFRLRKNIKSILGESGKSKEGLIKLLKKIPDNITREKYLEFKNSKYYEDDKYKYAASVPHLFIYTKKSIPVFKHQVVTI